jgi:hypothetical protein
MTYDLAKHAKAAAELLKKEFLEEAYCRRIYHDRWNVEAAALLERLANTVDEIDPALLVAYVELWEGSNREAITLSNMLREIGFQRAPQTASEFVSEFISKMTSGT